MTDIDKAVKEAAEFEAQDKKRKEAIDTRNEADAYGIPDRKSTVKKLETNWMQQIKQQ